MSRITCSLIFASGLVALGCDDVGSAPAQPEPSDCRSAERTCPPGLTCAEASAGEWRCVADFAPPPDGSIAEGAAPVAGDGSLTAVRPDARPPAAMADARPAQPRGRAPDAGLDRADVDGLDEIVMPDLAAGDTCDDGCDAFAECIVRACPGYDGTDRTGWIDACHRHCAEENIDVRPIARFLYAPSCTAFIEITREAFPVFYEACGIDS